jgi:hypothetical protein
VKARLLEMTRKPDSVAFEPVPESELLELLREAIRRVCGSDKAGAIDMGVSAGQLSRWVNGVEPFRIGQLARCAPIQREFAYLLAERCGHEVRRVGDAERRRRRIRSLQGELLELMQQEERASA